MLVFHLKIYYQEVKFVRWPVKEIIKVWWHVKGIKHGYEGMLTF